MSQATMRYARPDLRRSERISVTLPARCRTHRNLHADVVLSDITAEGCSIFTKNIFLRVGERVVIRPESLEGLPAIVRWAYRNRAGVEFEQPLYGPVAEHLQQRYVAFPPQSAWRTRPLKTSMI